jgi:hypothetical protein
MSLRTHLRLSDVPGRSLLVFLATLNIYFVGSFGSSYIVADWFATHVETPAEAVEFSVAITWATTAGATMLLHRLGCRSGWIADHVVRADTYLDTIEFPLVGSSERNEAADQPEVDDAPAAETQTAGGHSSTNHEY